jgi:phosphoglycolate phosphatase
LFAINWINQVHLLLSRPVEFLLVGDTVHDFEVASELGCACILVSNGHQSYERLKSTGVLVIEDLAQLMS